MKPMHSVSIGRSLLLVGLLASTPALVQAGERTTSGHEGFVAGLTLGTGLTSPCNAGDCPMNAAGSAHIGAMARRDLAILADFSVVRAGGGKPGSLGAAALAVRYGPADRFGLEAGAGGSRTFDWSDWGDARNPQRRRLTGIAGAGFEILRGDVFVVDLQARSAFTADNHSFAAGIGFNWY